MVTMVHCILIELVHYLCGAGDFLKTT